MEEEAGFKAVTGTGLVTFTSAHVCRSSSGFSCRVGASCCGRVMTPLVQQEAVMHHKQTQTDVNTTDKEAHVEKAEHFILLTDSVRVNGSVCASCQ